MTGKSQFQPFSTLGRKWAQVSRNNSWPRPTETSAPEKPFDGKLPVAMIRADLNASPFLAYKEFLPVL